MPAKIHPTAVVSPKAHIAEGVEIGPYVIIEDHVTIGRGTKIAPHCVISGYTEIGSDNQIGVGAVIGLEPQDLAYKEGKSFVKIGDRNKIREYVQIHRGTKEDTATVIGNDNFLLGFSHVAHNCQLGNHIILANGALLAGYVQVEDFCFISGLCLVHQFCRIGQYAMMRGGSRISLDLPPYCVADEANTVRGINTIGLERRGFTTSQILGIKRIYKEIFNSKTPMNDLINSLLGNNQPKEIKYFLEFIKNSPRGICRPS